MNAKEIEAKATAILEARRRGGLCLEAGICVYDGERLVTSWTVERHFLWFRWTARVHGFSTSSPAVVMKCPKCNRKYTRW